VVVNSKCNGNCGNPINRRSAFIGIRNGGGISISNRYQILVFFPVLFFIGLQ